MIRTSEKITVLTTGGTIDKEYNLNSEMVIGNPRITEILARIRTDITFEVRPVLRLDSLDMTDTDRRLLVAALEDTDTDRVLVTHGTDTMAETARYLHRHANHTGKTVVLCGAIQPAIMRDTDADFNVGAAVAALNLLEPGIYISMSGKIFTAESVSKDRTRGIFTVAKESKTLR